MSGVCLRPARTLTERRPPMPGKAKALRGVTRESDAGRGAKAAR
jgi:hypothetical protein